MCRDSAIARTMYWNRSIILAYFLAVHEWSSADNLDASTLLCDSINLKSILRAYVESGLTDVEWSLCTIRYAFVFSVRSSSLQTSDGRAETFFWSAGKYPPILWRYSATHNMIVNSCLYAIGLIKRTEWCIRPFSYLDFQSALETGLRGWTWRSRDHTALDFSQGFPRRRNEDGHLNRILQKFLSNASITYGNSMDEHNCFHACCPWTIRGLFCVPKSAAYDP